MQSGAKQGDQDILFDTLLIKQDTVAQKRAVAAWGLASYSPTKANNSSSPTAKQNGCFAVAVRFHS